jgi:signal transduction histidine kinase/CHASE3 domain sensor protein
MRRHLTVARLLNRAFAGMVALILLSGTAGVVASVLQHRSVRQLSEQIMPLRLANAHLRVVMGDAQRSLRGFLLSGDARSLATYMSAAAEFGPTVRLLRSRAVSEVERAAVERQVELAGRWWRHADRQRTIEPRSARAGTAVESGRALFEPIQVANDLLDRDLAAHANAVRHRSDILRTATLVGLIASTSLAALIAAGGAVRTTARITRPLLRHAAVLQRLGEGDRSARAPVDVQLAEMAAVARAVNAMADEADRGRDLEAERVRLQSAAHELGISVRDHLSVSAAMDRAASGLGPMLIAEHVVVRLSKGEGTFVTGARWSRSDVSPGTTELLAGLSPDWLVFGADGAGRARIWTDLDAGDVPPEERAALLAAAATATLAVAFRAATGPSGTVTVIRCDPDAGWSEQEARAVESVTADLGRGLLQAKLYEREQELVARLRDLDNAKTDFMSTVSHELRTPLTSIAGYLEMLGDGDVGELTGPQLRMLGVIERNTVRLQALIENLLVLSRIESGTLRSDRREIEYGWLVTSAVAAVAPAATAAGVVVDTVLGGALIGAADAEQIDRLLMNLLSNGVKFSSQGGRVQVRVDRDHDEIVIAVSDSGIGIPQAEQHHVFTRFFRASNATDQAYQGTGLGLAIARTIVEQHGGRIWLESREGAGTTVTVRLPS